MIPIVADLPPQQEAAKHVEYMNRLPSHIDNGLYTINLPEGYGKNGPVSRYGFGDSLFEMPQVKIPVKDEPPDDVPKAEEILQGFGKAQTLTQQDFDERFGDSVDEKLDGFIGKIHPAYNVTREKVEAVDEYFTISGGGHDLVYARSSGDNVRDYMLFFKDGELIDFESPYRPHKSEILDLGYQDGRFIFAVEGEYHHKNGNVESVSIISVYDPDADHTWILQNTSDNKLNTIVHFDNMDSDEETELVVITSEPAEKIKSFYVGVDSSGGKSIQKMSPVLDVYGNSR